MRTLPLYLFLISLFFAACSGDTPKQNETKDSEVSTVSSNEPDSLGYWYQHFIATREDWYPEDVVSEKGKVYAVDEAIKDTTFFVFREKLRAAVEQKDVFFIMENISEKVESGFEGEEGVAAFVQNWRLGDSESVKKSRLWPILERILKDGGTFFDNNNQFLAPYLVATFPQDFDPQIFGAVLGSGVRLRKDPNTKGPVLQMVSNEVVEIIEVLNDQKETIQGETYPWVFIKLLDGTEGYVWGKFIGKANGYKVVFKKEPDWKIQAITAGL